jgi:predicted dehydrogenase
MLDVFAPITDACRTSVPAQHRHRRPVAAVGAGVIVDAARLPAYRGAVVEVRGSHDLDPGRARDIAARHGPERAYATLDELLADPAAAGVDTAVAPDARPGVACRAPAAGKHLRCRKPFAPDPATGAQLIAPAELHAGRPDTPGVDSRVLPTGGWPAYPVTRRWIPDACAGPMASLLRAVAGDGGPDPSARGTLGTIRLVDAVSRSMDTSHRVRVETRAA